MKSHTGGTLSLGKGSVYLTSTKQKLNTKSSTEAELVGVDDVMPLILWTQYFWMLRAMACARTRCFRITKVPFYWKRTDDAPVVVRPTTSIFAISSSRIIFSRRNSRWNIAQLEKCWLICLQSLYRAVLSIIFVMQL
jgi:hypothetical protein